TASSRTIGWPLSIANCARRSAPFWPDHETTSVFWSTAAVSPCAALYCDRLQLRESASSTGIGDRRVDASHATAAVAAAARAADTTVLFALMCASMCRAPLLGCRMSEPETHAQARDAGRDDVGDVAERWTRLEIRRRRRRGVQYVEEFHVD